MEKILKALRERGMSKLALAKATGITPSDFYSALNGRKPFYPKYRRAVAEYFGVDELDLFSEEAGNNE